MTMRTLLSLLAPSCLLAPALAKEPEIRKEIREENGKKVQKAEVNAALCTGCGACVAVCPENAINVKGWTLKQYEAMVDMIVSDEVVA